LHIIDATNNDTDIFNTKIFDTCNIWYIWCEILRY